MLFVALGDEAAALGLAGVDVRFVDDQTDPTAMAQYHQAADVYVHAARADTFPSTILEALACGTPVVATAVGGIPEQIRPAHAGAFAQRERTGLEHATGVLVPAGDADAMAEAVVALLGARVPRRLLGDNAVRDVRERFDLNRQVECYLAWYRTIIDDWNGMQCPTVRRLPPAPSARGGWPWTEEPPSSPERCLTACPGHASASSRRRSTREHSSKKRFARCCSRTIRTSS